MTIERPIQRTLDLRAADGSRLAFLRPMLGIESVKAVLDVSEDEVLELLAGGALRWGWDLKAEGGGARSFVRVWSRSVTCYLHPGHQPAEPEEIEDVIGLLLSAERGSVSRSAVAGDIAAGHRPALQSGSVPAIALQRIFNASSGHVLNLIRADALELTKSSQWRRGPGGSPEVTRASVVELLKARRIL